MFHKASKFYFFAFLIVILLGLTASSRQISANSDNRGQSRRLIAEQNVFRDSQGFIVPAPDFSNQISGISPQNPRNQDPIINAGSLIYWNFPAVAFTPVNNTTDYGRADFGCIKLTSVGSDDLFTVPLSLPHGTRIVRVVLEYRNSSTSNMHAWVTRYHYTGSSYEDVVTLQAIPGSKFVALTIDHTIDQELWAYVLHFRLGVADSQTACDIYVQYEKPNIFALALPVIQK